MDDDLPGQPAIRTALFLPYAGNRVVPWFQTEAESWLGASLREETSDLMNRPAAP